MYIFLYSTELQIIFLYSTELLCLNLKTKYLASVYLSNTVLLFGSAHKDRLDGNIKKQTAKNKNKNKTKQKVLWRTETPSRHTQRKPAPHRERRNTLETMLKIEDAAGVNLSVGTDKFKTRKINADKAKKVYA